MSSSFLSSQFKRAGEVLRGSASDQIIDYTRRFESIKDIYDGFLKDLIVKDFSAGGAAEAFAVSALCRAAYLAYHVQNLIVVCAFDG